MRVASTTGLVGLAASAGIVSAQGMNVWSWSTENDNTRRDLFEQGSDIYSPENIRNSTRPLVDSILKIYYENGTSPAPGFIPGLFPDPYYWWESGLAFDSLINYWAYSEDETVVDVIRDAMQFQVGPQLNYMPPNQSKSLGNDDQSFWALAAMTAAEYGFPAPTSLNVSWFQLAKNVFESQAHRWDRESCGGGFKWQIFSFNNGYNYKNSLTQANFAQLSARLYRYTNNLTYLDWAHRVSEWSFNIGLIDDSYDVFDGTDDSGNCSEINHIQWTASAGQFLNAYAYACNATSSCSGRLTSLGGIASTIEPIFTKDDILYEVACAPSNNCNTDQLAFRAPLARALANVRDMASDNNATSQIDSIINASSQGAAASCGRGDDEIARCGSDWASTASDDPTGLGQDLSALEMLLAVVPRKQMNTNTRVRKVNGSTTGGSNSTDTGNGSSESGSTTPANGAAGLMPSLVTLGFLGAFSMLF